VVDERSWAVAASVSLTTAPATADLWTSVTVPETVVVAAVCAAAGSAKARVDNAGLPSRYLRRFRYDTLVQRPEALRYLVQLVGHDRVMLGSDHPFWMGDPDPLKVVREAGLDPATETAIFGGTAAQIFHLRP